MTTCLKLGRTDWFKFGSFSLDSFRKYLKICLSTGVSKIFNEAQLKIFLLDQLGRRLLLHPVPLNPTSDYKDPTALVDFFLNIFKSSYCRYIQVIFKIFILHQFSWTKFFGHIQVMFNVDFKSKLTKEWQKLENGR